MKSVVNDHMVPRSTRVLKMFPFGECTTSGQNTYYTHASTSCQRSTFRYGVTLGTVIACHRYKEENISIRIKVIKYSEKTDTIIYVVLRIGVFYSLQNLFNKCVKHKYGIPPINFLLAVFTIGICSFSIRFLCIVFCLSLLIKCL